MINVLVVIYELSEDLGGLTTKSDNADGRCGDGEWVHCDRIPVRY